MRTSPISVFILQFLKGYTKIRAMSFEEKSHLHANHGGGTRSINNDICSHEVPASNLSLGMFFSEVCCFTQSQNKAT